MGTPRNPVTRFGGGGFGGFTPNPSVRYPGGTVTQSSVDQAAMNLEFGATTTTPTPSPTVTPTVPSYNVDPSGSGMVNSTLTADSYNAQPSSRDRPYVRSTPDEPMVADSRSDGLPTRPGLAGDEPVLYADPSATPGASPTSTPIPARGDPTVQVAWQSGVSGGAPVWWSTPNPTMFANPWWASFSPRLGGNVSSFDLQPQVRAAQDVAVGQTTLNSSTGRLQSYNGSEWVDAGPANPQNVVPPADRSNSPQPEPTSDLPPEQQASGSDNAATASSAPARGAQPQQQSNAGKIAAIVQTFPGLNNPAAIRAIEGGASVRDLVGHAQFDSHAANLMEMAFQSFGGTPNDTGATSDAGLNRFLNGIWQLDPETGGFTQTGDRTAALRPTSTLVNSAAGIAAYNRNVSRGG